MTKNQFIQVVALGATVSVMIAVAVAAFSQSTVSGPPGLDKIFHAFAFACLALPMAIARPKYVWWIVCASAAYGGIIELVQPYVGRQAEWLDFCSDVAGAIVGGFIGSKLGSVVSTVVTG